MSENKEPTTQEDVTRNSLSDRNKELVKAVEKLEKEVFYNRLVFTLFFLAAMFYIDLKVGRLGDVIGVLIEMFMPS